MSTSKPKAKPSKSKPKELKSSKKVTSNAIPQKAEYVARTLQILKSAKKSALRLSKKTSKQLNEVVQDMASDFRSRLDRSVESSLEKKEVKKARRFLDQQHSQALGQYDRFLNNLGLMRVSANQ